MTFLTSSPRYFAAPKLILMTSLGILISACGGKSHWTWIDVPGSACASGTATGFAISPVANSKKLMIYLQGGGSCYDYDTCWTDPKAANTAGYDSNDFAQEPKTKNYVILSRKDTRNPFIDTNMAYVPYCTGDFHSGYNLQTLSDGNVSKDTHFYGGHNMDLFLAEMRNRFPDIEQVWLVGTSAGGAGTAPNFFKVKDTFNTRVDIINDSGTPLPVPRAVDAQSLWGTPVIPGCESGCTTPEQQLHAVRQADPSSRYALLSYAYDNILAKGYGIGLENFNTQLNLTLTHLASDQHFKSFFVNNPKSTPQHVIMGHFSNSVLMDHMSAWLGQMVTDDAAWDNVVLGN